MRPELFDLYKAASENGLDLLKMAGTKDDLISAQGDPEKKDRLKSLLERFGDKSKYWKFISSSLDVASDAQIMDYISEFEKREAYIKNKDMNRWDFKSLEKEIELIKSLEFLAQNSVSDFAEEKKILISSGIPPKEADSRARGIVADKLISSGKVSEGERDRFLSLLSREIRLFRGERAIEKEKSLLSDEAVKVGKTAEELARGASDIIFENKNYLVVLPGTVEASKFWGSGTRWCTAAESRNQFMNYSSRGVYLYYILDKFGDPRDLYSKVAISIVKKDGSILPNPEVNLADDARSSLSAVASGLRVAEDFEKIRSAIWSDAAGRPETKWEEMIADLTPEELSANLAGLDSENKRRKFLSDLAPKIDKIRDGQVREMIAGGMGPYDYFKMGFHGRPEFKKLLKDRASDLDSRSYFEFGLHLLPELSKETDNMIEKAEPIIFIGYGFHKDPAYAKLTERKVLEMDPVDYYGLKLDVIPELSGFESRMDAKLSESDYPMQDYDRLKTYSNRFMEDGTFKLPIYRNVYKIFDHDYFNDRLAEDPSFAGEAFGRAEGLDAPTFFYYYFDGLLSAVPGIEDLILNKADGIGASEFFEIFYDSRNANMGWDIYFAPLPNIESVMVKKFSQLSFERVEELDSYYGLSKIPFLEPLIEDMREERLEMSRSRPVKTRHMKDEVFASLISSLVKLGFDDIAAKILNIDLEN